MANQQEVVLLNQLLGQLEWIRISLQILIALAVIFVIVTGSFVWGVMKAIKGKPVEFPVTGQTLLNQEKYTEVVELGTKYLHSFPGDVNARWLVAEAHLRIGKLSEALAHAKKIRELKPDWEASYVGPFIAHVESELEAAKGRPDLKIVLPSPMSDAPPRGAPLS